MSDKRPLAPSQCDEHHMIAEMPQLKSSRHTSRGTLVHSRAGMIYMLFLVLFPFHMNLVLYLSINYISFQGVGNSTHNSKPGRMFIVIVSLLPSTDKGRTTHLLTFSYRFRKDFAVNFESQHSESHQVAQANQNIVRPALLPVSFSLPFAKLWLTQCPHQQN